MDFTAKDNTDPGDDQPKQATDQGNVSQPDTEAGSLEGQANGPSGQGPKKGPGRPKGSGKGPGRPKGSGQGQKKRSKKSLDTSAEATADMTNRMFFSLCAQMGGEEMLPSNDEKKHLDSALAEYLKTKEDLAPPPGMVLTMAYASFVLKKTEKPTVRENLSIRLYQVAGASRRAWNRVKGKIKMPNLKRKDK